MKVNTSLYSLIAIFVVAVIMCGYFTKLQNPDKSFCTLFVDNLKDTANMIVENYHNNN